MKILKFDTLYPTSYLQTKINQNIEQIKKMNFIEYNDWLIKLRMNFSDFYTFNLREEGWEANEIFLHSNRYYIRKLGIHYYGIAFYLIQLIYKLRNSVCKSKKSLLEKLIKKIIYVERPDVIFIREQSGVNSLFWNSFRNKALVVSRMECGVPKYWSPSCYDLVYTNINTYRDFFNSNRIPTKTNYSGFDKRILDEIEIRSRKYDVTFVGGLGNPTFTEKTDFLESILKKKDNSFNFKWWGYKEGNDFDKTYPLLSKCYEGEIGGLDMFQLYSESKIVLNDYGIAAGGQGMNMRIYEVMGIGRFLLTRKSTMFNDWGDVITTFSDTDDCLEKIYYYLIHNEEREEIAKIGQEFILKHHNYKGIMRKLSEELKEYYKLKFG